MDKIINGTDNSELLDNIEPEIKDEVTEYTVDSINDYFANKK